MPELTREQQKERIRRRVKAAATSDNSKRISIYARVSTDVLEQNTSVEQQQKNFTDLLILNCNRRLTKIYLDEGNAAVSESGAETEESPDA